MIEWHTKEELNVVAVAARDGDERAKAALAIMMEPYVVAQARRFADAGDGFRWDQRDDITAAAWTGVWAALHSFDDKPNSDTGRTTKFSTYATYKMRYEIQKWVAANARALPMSRRQWALGLKIEEAWAEQHPDQDIHEASDEELAALWVQDTDDKSRKRQVPQAGDIMRAKRAPDEYDEGAVEHPSSPSAEAEFFDEVYGDKDSDALDTLAAMIEAANPDKAYSLALDFCDRHGLPVEVADRMMEVEL